MAADLNIHIYEGITEEDMRDFFCNSIGSKWSPLTFAMTPPEGMGIEEYAKSDPARARVVKAQQEMDERKPRWDSAYEKMSNTPRIWIGEVSWLKAGLFDDEETFVPDPVDKVRNAIGEDLPVLDDELIENIMKALEAENTTGYSVTDPEDVREFLEEHKGKQVFTISW